MTLIVDKRNSNAYTATLPLPPSFLFVYFLINNVVFFFYKYLLCPSDSVINV